MVNVVSLDKMIEMKESGKDTFSFDSVKTKILNRLHTELKKYDKLSNLSDEQISNIKSSNRRTGKRKSYQSTLILTTPNGSVIPVRYGTLTICGCEYDVSMTDRENIEEVIRCIEDGELDSVIEDFIKNDKKFLKIKNRDYSLLRKKKNS